MGVYDLVLRDVLMLGRAVLARVGPSWRWVDETTRVCRGSVGRLSPKPKTLNP